MTSQPLKPCPFCGGPAELLGTEYEGFLHCADDQCLVKPSTFGKRVGRGGNLVEAWNRRAEPEALAVPCKCTLGGQ